MNKWIDLKGNAIVFGHSKKDELDSYKVGDITFRSPFKLNLGSGYRREIGYINIDNREICNPDIVWDLTGGIPFPDNSVEEVKCYDILEHFAPLDRIPIVEEIYRVLVPNGLWDIFVPSTDGRGAWMDPTHLSGWNICSFMYYSVPEYRALYGIKACFSIEHIQDVLTDQFRGIIHTVGKLRKVVT